MVCALYFGLVGKKFWYMRICAEFYSIENIIASYFKPLNHVHFLCRGKVTVDTDINVRKVIFVKNASRRGRLGCIIFHELLSELFKRISCHPNRLICTN